MNELKVVGSNEFLGKQVKIIEGGFGDCKRCILAKDIANIHNVELSEINRKIKDNIDEFEIGVDILNLLGMENLHTEILLDLGFTNESINSTIGKNGNIYLLSESGYMTLCMFMRTKIAKENRIKFKREYFTMREVINSDEQLKAMALLKAVESNGIESIQAIKIYSDLRIKEETKELVTTIKVKDKIIDDVIKDDGIYAINTIGKMLQSYNKQIGARKIFDYLRNKKILMDCKGRQNHNLPYSTYANYFDVKYVDVDFGMYNSSVPKVYFNGKGVKWFLNRLAKESYISKDDIKNIESNIAA